VYLELDTNLILVVTVISLFSCGGTGNSFTVEESKQSFLYSNEDKREHLGIVYLASQYRQCLTQRWRCFGGVFMVTLSLPAQVPAFPMITKGL
jgi:hypothetical protein